MAAVVVCVVVDTKTSECSTIAIISNSTSTRKRATATNAIILSVSIIGCNVRDVMIEAMYAGQIMPSS